MQFDAPSKSMVSLFAIAVVLMALHKIECWLTTEWTVSPFFHRLVAGIQSYGGTSEEMIGRALFASFVVWLFVGLGMGLLILRGGAGPLVALGIWGLTFLLEWHHLVRAALTGSYYSGLLTAVIYVAFGVAYWQALLRHVHLGRTAQTPFKV